ncbi:MAG TPA: hypothetical protein VFJ14_17455 [Nocardioidaceae bacterium]|nr:hypothetical protein [Nocardioidaceae bacterium]
MIASEVLLVTAMLTLLTDMAYRQNTTTLPVVRVIAAVELASARSDENRTQE